jgi:phosphoesterase RecJ-like protein
MAPEYRFLRGIDEISIDELPADHGERTLCALDCGNEERIGNSGLLEAAPSIINIDHHSDNSRFGDVNLVDGEASSTAEIIFFILQKMGVRIDAEIAEDLYIGILVDSGRFQYSSATPDTFRVAAELIASGVDHTGIFRKVYETVPLAKSRLICRMFANLTLACDDSLAIGAIEADDFRETGADAGMTEGLVDSLRSIDGVDVAALIYKRPAADAAEEAELPYRVSLRASSGGTDVQAIANLMNGGGHRQAAGFSNDMELADIVDFIIKKVSEQLEGG